PDGSFELVSAVGTGLRVEVRVVGFKNIEIAEVTVERGDETALGDLTVEGIALTKGFGVRDLPEIPEGYGLNPSRWGESTIEFLGDLLVWDNVQHDRHVFAWMLPDAEACSGCADARAMLLQAMETQEQTFKSLLTAGQRVGE